jgi:haloacetate dehalogenase
MDPDAGFETRRVALGDIGLFVRRGGRRGAPPLLLLHGYPQTGALWRRVAGRLAGDFELVVPDLRGYGRSSQPPGAPDHANYSKRAMADDMARLMTAFGHERFAVCGHDRGGRVAHRLALDHPHRVDRLVVLDIAPTLAMYERTTMAFAQAYYHWFHLIQPAPLPETHIGADPLFHLHAKLRAWGSGSLEIFEPEALAEYEAAFARPETIHATCEDYRASAGIDLEHDRASLAAGHRLACPLLALWGDRGVVQRMFEPLALWQAVCDRPVQGRAVPSGHFIPEELPELTARELAAFCAAADT